MIDNGGAGGGGVSLGAALGRAVAKSTKKSTGSSVGRAVSNINRSSGSSSSRSSGGGSEGSSGGGGGGGSSSGRSFGSSTASAVPHVPSLAQFLGGDSTYQSSLSGSKRTLADFLSDLNRRRGEATTQYNQTTASMGRDRDQQLEDLKNEFASRGLIQSGLYGQEQGKFQQQFTDQQNALSQQQTGLLADLMSQQTNYQREQDLALQAAKQDALQRRAAQYNIGG